MSSNNSKQIPVVTIDGPAGVGKGTLAKKLADMFEFNYLDSGAVYRALSVKALKENIPLDNVSELIKLASQLSLEFPQEKRFAAHIDGENIDASLRSEECSSYASQVAEISDVRIELLALQRRFQRAPGLVGDGRDLGTVVFPQAEVKIFLDASCEERAQRRYKQLIDQGISANFDHLFDSIRARDERDRTRSAAPLVAAKDAMVIDSTQMSIETVVSSSAAIVRERLFME
ncbi:MAG: (d)CMP kinase [Gammaproteobacteria bacterium]|nr:(d)CMP kinase [Gammaproteobacteria bacterium]